jgi:hypothetical protein
LAVASDIAQAPFRSTALRVDQLQKVDAGELAPKDLYLDNDANDWLPLRRIITPVK